MPSLDFSCDCSKARSLSSRVGIESLPFSSISHIVVPIIYTILAEGNALYSQIGYCMLFGEELLYIPNAGRSTGGRQSVENLLAVAFGVQARVEDSHDAAIFACA